MILLGKAQNPTSWSEWKGQKVLKIIQCAKAIEDKDTPFLHFCTIFSLGLLNWRSPTEGGVLLSVSA